MALRKKEEIKQQENFTFHYEKKGLFMLCQSNKTLDAEAKVVQLAKNEGLKAEVLTFEEVKKKEPNINMKIIGATYYECDNHTTPNEFMEEMKTYLKTVGVQFYKNERVEDIIIKNKKIASVITNKQELKSDEFVLTAGSWTSLLSKKIGLNLLLQAGKGYRINSYKNTNITIPAILAEAYVAVTPMNGFTRFAGTMEIAGINQSINKTRVEAIVNAVSKYYPEIVISKKEKEEVTSGLRPVSPDGLPYIGKSEKCKNLTIATGHAMMGWSMATATGKLVSEIISQQKLSINSVNFHPDRKF
jgi:D-amino-acid dehydrogenase